MQKHHYIIFTSVISCLILVFMLSLASAQSIDHLVRIHSAKNTEMRPLDVERVEDHIYTVYEYIHRDTIKIDGQPLGLDTLPGEQMPIVISQFDTSHQLLRTGVLTASRPFRGAIAYQNVRYHGDRIYVFVSIYDHVLRYNGETIWTSTPVEDILNINRWFVMVTLDSDLNLVSVKGIDHWYSGYEDIAFGEDRMYLFGRVSHGASFQDTVFVDGYGVAKMVNERYTTTTFMFTYEVSTGKLLNTSRINVKDSGRNVGTIFSKIGPDGKVYQIMNTFGSRLINEKNDTIIINSITSNSILIKYGRGGDLEIWTNYLKSPEVNTNYLGITKQGDIWLLAKVRVVLGGYPISLPYSHSVVVLRISSEDLKIKWYDYISVKEFSTNGFQAFVHAGKLSIDENENVYTVSSFTNKVRASVDMVHQNLTAGIHIQKYDRDGNLICKIRWPNSIENPGIMTGVLSENKLIIFKNADGMLGEYDSIVNERNLYFSQMFLFQHKLEQIASTTKNILDEGILLTLYPNPVHKGGNIKIYSEEGMLKESYTIMDGLGRLKGQGMLDKDREIAIGNWDLQGGVYFLVIGKETPIIQKFVIVN